VRHLSNLIYATRNLTANIVYILTHFWRIPTGLRKLQRVHRDITTLGLLRIFMAVKCRYKRESWDWKAWALTFAMRNWTDDCDSYANFARHIARRNGWTPANYYSVYGDGWGHAACLFICGSEKYIAGTKGVREFKGWKHHFPGMTKKIKRW
jgi:hypothetical protein